MKMFLFIEQKFRIKSPQVKFQGFQILNLKKSLN